MFLNTSNNFASSSSPAALLCKETKIQLFRALLIFRVTLAYWSVGILVVCFWDAWILLCLVGMYYVISSSRTFLVPTQPLVANWKDFEGNGPGSGEGISLEWLSKIMKTLKSRYLVSESRFKHVTFPIIRRIA